MIVPEPNVNALPQGDVETLKSEYHSDTLASPVAVIVPCPCYAARVLLRLPTWAWNPLLIGLTLRRLPHDSHAMKKIRFSFVRRVSGDLQVLQVTYSTFKGALGVKRRRPPDIMKHTNVSPQDVLDLFLLEFSLDDQPACAINTTCCSHFGEQELDNVFRLYGR